MQQCLIYGLVDPRTFLINYVGLSSKGLKRPRQHRWNSKRENSFCLQWMIDLHQAGLVPQIVVLEECLYDLLKSDERWWIAYGHASGWPLKNLNAGGAGSLNPHPSTRERLSRAGRATAADPAYRAALSERTRRQMQNPEQREIRRRGMLARGPEFYLAAAAAAAAKRKHRKSSRVVRIYPMRKTWRLLAQASSWLANPVSIATLQNRRARLSESARVRQADPAVKARISKARKAYFANPEAVERLSEQVKRTWTPERRAAMSESARQRQADPAVRAAISARSKRARARERNARL
jgi:hypothetical protein